MEVKFKIVTKIDEASNYLKKVLQTKWVKWIHHGTNPAENNVEKSANVLKGAFTKHCAICLNLNGCCFVKEKRPTKPLHPNCHCDTTNINPITVNSECPIEKFTKYAFIASAINDKKTVVRTLGIYELGLLNEYGQRINIVITLKRKNTHDYVSFRSGWMVYPNGKIVLITLFGRK